MYDDAWSCEIEEMFSLVALYVNRELNSTKAYSETKYHGDERSFD
jgi:hypothetical protein